MAGKGKGEGRGGRRRGHGEGSIFQRADGRWVAQLPPDPESGRRKTFVGATRAAVHARLAAALHDRAAGLPLATTRQNVKEYLSAWLDTMRPPRTSLNGYNSLRQMVRLHLDPTLGRTALAKLTPLQIQRLYADKLAAGLSGTTVRLIHTTLHLALAAAVRLQLVPRNVADLVDVPRARRREMRVWTAEQARRFLDVAEGDALDGLYVLALTTGMRLSELAGLLWRHVEMDARAGVGRLRVLTQLQHSPASNSGFVLTAPKTAAGRRTIALARVAVEALAARRHEQEQERAAAGALWQAHDLVFANALGMPYHRGLIRNRFQRLVARRCPDVPRIRFHDLRHTCATLLLSRGVHIKVVSEMLGHASVAITLAIYAHVLPDMQDAATATMDRLLGAPGRPAGPVEGPVRVQELPAG